LVPNARSSLPALETSLLNIFLYIYGGVWVWASQTLYSNIISLPVPALLVVAAAAAAIYQKKKEEGKKGERRNAK
jgi:hypothetical protein